MLGAALLEVHRRAKPNPNPNPQPQPLALTLTLTLTKAYYLDSSGAPSPMMRESLLWRLHHHRYDPREPPLTLFEEAYTTKHRMVRIFKVRRA